MTLLAALLLAALAGAEPDAVILEDTETFRMNSPTSGEFTVSQTFRVNNEEGLDAASLVLFTDSFRELKSFKGEITPSSGKPLKIKQGDIVFLSLNESLADDARVYTYRPSVKQFPMVVHYEYKVNYRKGIASFPTFAPVSGENTAVEKAVFTLDVPVGTPVKYSAGKVEYSVENRDGRSLHRWQVHHLPAIRLESMMPPLRELIPLVYSSPVNIDYGGYKGTQADWTSLGRWLWTLQEGTRELPAPLVEEVQAMTAPCSTRLEKLQVLYRYFRDKTRYVSIQLGIGGLKPMAASEVAKLGFGDCKGLSNYLKALLAAAGVESDCYIISTDRKDLLPGYASVGQMNHMMLAVPLPELKDTAWVECTNPVYPLGYRHRGAAGHEVVLIKPEGGEKIRIPAYADTLSRAIQRTEVFLKEDGSATLDLQKELWLDELEPYLEFGSLPKDKQVEQLTQALKLQGDQLVVNGFRNNFDSYASEGAAFRPCITVDYSMKTRIYANGSNLQGEADRLFVPLNPIAQAVDYQRAERENDIYVNGFLDNEDIIVLHIPEGFEVEALPDDVAIDDAWGVFSSSARLEGDTIRIRQHIRLRSCREPAQRYADFRRFARAVNKAYSATLVLRKKQAAA